MKSTTAPRSVARALAVLLWIAGSAYLVRNELAMPSPDWVVIATMPLIWAAVIALPILAHHAWTQREFTACVLLALAAVVGSCFTLQGTIARQSEARDGKVAEAQASNFKRSELLEELGRAQKRFDDANKYADAERGTTCGPRCKDWERRAVEVKAYIDQTTAAIATLGADKPVASGEKRVAAAVALLPFVTAQPAKIEAAVALFLPSLFGLFLELAALASAFFGWRPGDTTPATPAKTAGQTDFEGVGTLPSPSMFTADAPDPPKPRKRSKRAAKKEATIAAIRAHTLKHGAPPSFSVVRSRHRLSNGSAHRYLKAALAAAN